MELPPGNVQELLLSSSGGHFISSGWFGQQNEDHHNIRSVSGHQVMINVDIREGRETNRGRKYQGDWIDEGRDNPDKEIKHKLIQM